MMRVVMIMLMVRMVRVVRVVRVVSLPAMKCPDQCIKVANRGECEVGEGHERVLLVRATRE